VAFKWSRGDKVLLPALSGVVRTDVLTLQRYKLTSKLPNKTHFFSFFRPQESYFPNFFVPLPTVRGEIRRDRKKKGNGLT